MAPRENLIPTPTVDKNGRQTTVYRKSGGKGRAKSVPSPAVSAAAEARSTKLVQTALEIFRGTQVDAASRRSIIDQLHNCSDELVERIHSSLLSVEDFDDRLQLSSKIRIKFDKRFYAEDGFEERLDDALYFYPLLPHRSFSFADKVIRSLRAYPQLPATKHFKDASSDLMVRYVALARTIDAVLTVSAISGPFRRGGVGDVYVFDNDKLTELVLDYPEQSDRITSIIKDRGMYDPELLRLIIEGGASALGSGTL